MKPFILVAGRLFGIMMMVFFIVFQPVNDAQATPDEVTVRKLLATPDEYNLKPITISGEVIGQPLFREHGAWFHLLDEDQVAIGIWTDKTTIESIHFFGRYGIKGDHITLQGTFFNAHPAHGGDTCIELEVILFHEPGYEKSIQPVERNKWFIASLLGLFCLIVWIIDRIKNKKLDD